MKNTILLTVATLFITSFITAQTLSHKWANKIGDKSYDVGAAICMDEAGNTYMVGYFTDSTDLDPSTNEAKLYAQGSYDIFIAKYDIDGKYVWGKGIGGSNSEFGNSIAIDGTGNIYIAGVFRGTVDFDPSANVANLISAGGDDIFYAKYDGNGNYLWANKIGSTGYEYAQSMAVETNGNIYITGYFAGTVDFDPSANTTTLSSNVNDAYIAKYNTSGNFVWAKKIGGTWDDYAQSITLDKSNNIIVTGHFNGTVNFDPGGGTSGFITSTGGEDIFLAKYSSTGAYLWAISIGSASGNSAGDGRCVKTDNGNNIYVTGLLFGTLDFDPSSNNFDLTSVGAEDIFISKYNSNGNFLWAGNFGGSGTDIGISIAIDRDSCPYFTGFYQGVVDFDFSSGVSNVTSNGNNDIFIVKYSPSGVFKNVYSIGGPNNDKGLSIAINNKTDIRLTGFFSGTVDFDPTSSVNNISSNGLDDAFLIGNCGITPETPFAITGNNNVCPNQSYVFSVPNDTLVTNYLWTLPNGWIGNSNLNSITAKTGTSNGEISVIASNSCGNSPSQNKNITVNAIDLSISAANTTLTSNANNATYRWINCLDSSVIPNATAKSFTPTESGQYAVEITQNGCTDTSECRTVFMTSISDINTFKSNIYPNPSQGKFTLQVENNQSISNINILNCFGQSIEINSYIENDKVWYALIAPDGLYYVRIQYTNGSVITKPIVILN